MTLHEMIEWLQQIEQEFGDLKVIDLEVIPVHQNRTEVNLTLPKQRQKKVFGDPLRFYDRIPDKGKHP